MHYWVLDFDGNGYENLPLVEFMYSNSYQASLEMTLYEALYGRLCRLPSCWAEPDEHVMMGP